MGVQFPGKRRYVTLEWPLKCIHFNIDAVTFLTVSRITAGESTEK